MSISEIDETTSSVNAIQDFDTQEFQAETRDEEVTSNAEVGATRDQQKARESLHRSQPNIAALDKASITPNNCSSEIIIPPQGDYAKINIQKSHDIIEHIVSGSSSEKAQAAKIVAANQGSYVPWALLMAGFYFVEKKDFDQGVPLIVNASLRTELDIRLSQDKTLGGVPGIIHMHRSEVLQGLTEKEREIFTEKFKNAFENFEAWDRKTSRNYDCNWIRLHSMHAFNATTFKELDSQAKEAIIESLYRELKGECRSEDSANASRKDEYFFDNTDRKFYVTGSNFSFIVPDKVNASLDRFGEFTNELKLPNGVIWINTGWSRKKQSFEWDYNWELQYAKDQDPKAQYVVKQCTVGNGIPAYLERHIDTEDGRIFNTYHSVHDHDSFDIKLICTAENEAEYLKHLEAIVQAVVFSKQA